ncbi:MAG: DUF2442 domain-containing protein [Propionivibrio sp.]
MREKLPRIESASAKDGLRLALQFADGWTATVDLSRFITDFTSLAALADPALFAQASIDEWGAGVTWDNEGPLSIAATTLYWLAAEQSGEDSQRFDAWMAQHGFSSSKAAGVLGMTRRSIISYRTGSQPTHPQGGGAGLQGVGS